jgi:hypothetical protein
MELSKEKQGAELDFEVFSYEELVKLSQDLTKKVEILDSENIMLDSYLLRVIPVGKDEKLDTLGNHDLEYANKEKETRRDKKKKGEKQKDSDRFLMLTMDQKCEIATREIEELKDGIVAKKEEWAKIIDNSKVHDFVNKG